MTRLERRLETRLGIDDAFAFVADFGNAMHWDPGVATSKATSSGPTGKGSTYDLGVRMGSKVTPMEYRITEFEAPRKVVLAGTGKNVTATDEIRFTPAASGSGTTIDYIADIRLGGILGLIQPLLGRQFEKLARNAVEGMRKTLDARADAAAGATTETPATGSTPTTGSGEGA